MKEKKVKAYYVAVFDYEEDCYLQVSNTLSYENCLRLLENLREQHPHKDYVVLAVMDV